MGIERKDGAQDRTRTGTGCPTRPSNVRVYQFRHLGSKNVSTNRFPRKPIPRGCYGFGVPVGAGAAGATGMEICRVVAGLAGTDFGVVGVVVAVFFTGAPDITVLTVPLASAIPTVVT